MGRKIYHPPFEQKVELVGVARDRWDKLDHKYDLGALQDRYSQSLYQIQLYHLDLLDQYVSPFLCPSESLEIFDPGCDNWHYLPGLWHWARHYCRGANIDGMEIDPWRMYLNGHTKKSFAEGICRDYPGTTYLCGDSLTYHKSCDIIFSSLPFVEGGEATEWHLPRRHFNPRAQLEHLWDILSPGGILVVVNVDQSEWIAQEKLFARLGIFPQVAGEPFESILCPYPTTRVVSVACKPLDPLEPK